MRLIDANEVVKNIVAERDKIPRTVPAAPYELVKEKPYNHGNSMRGGIRKALRCIEQATTIDAVPVVRCRECEYAFKSGSSITGIRCEVWGTYDLFHACEPDWFCSHGKRKGGADNEP